MLKKGKGYHKGNNPNKAQWKLGIIAKVYPGRHGKER